MHVISTFAEGLITSETIFDFRETDGFVEASYAGGRVRSGHCVGRRVGDRFRLHYAHLDADDVVDTGKADLELELTGDGRVRVRQHALSDFMRASGTSVIEEPPAAKETEAPA